MISAGTGGRVGSGRVGGVQRGDLLRGRKSRSKDSELRKNNPLVTRFVFCV